jgi:hypothetical protein
MLTEDFANQCRKTAGQKLHYQAVFKLSNGQEIQVVGDGFRLSNRKRPTSLNSNIEREHRRLQGAFRPNPAPKKGGTKLIAARTIIA